jgi:hypothetical protein
MEPEFLLIIVKPNSNCFCAAIAKLALKNQVCD